MRRRNTRVSKHAKFACGPGGIVTLIVSMAAVGLIWFTCNTRCTRVSKEIGKCEKALKQLEDELTRANMRWDEMKTPGRIEESLVRFGLEMSYPNEMQIVRMDARGNPEPGQLSVARRRGAAGAGAVSVAGGTRANAGAPVRRMKRHGRSR